ncbi:MAG: hypothetical protein HUJ58_02695 [Erysipelotrichaceae bacterium]|nr:hypothetical protein [Erysipelotrichaceae bacterium]
MEPLLYFSEVIECLKQGEIVICVSGKSLQYIGYFRDGVRIKTGNASVRMEFDDFMELYKNEDFCRYNRKPEEVVDVSKDDVYYREWHK